MTVRALRSVDLSSAQSALMVANSPLFLLRKLRVDQSVTLIAREARGETVLNELKASLARNPRKMRTAVAPYVYLVALSMLPDIKYLRQSARIATPYHPWFSYLNEVLLQTYKATNLETVTLPGKRSDGSAGSSSSNSLTIALEN